MSWITVLWSAVAGACLMLALLHFLVWFQDRRGRAHLCFSVMVLGLLGVMACELILMRTESIHVAGRSVRWGHVASILVTAGCLGFVHYYFNTGRRWLLLTALGLRFLAVGANFTTGVNLHFREIQELGRIPFLGEMVTVPTIWTLNPWMVLGQLAALGVLGYTLDASWRLWKTGAQDAKRRAMVLGGSMLFFIVVAPASAGLVAAGVLRMPLLVSYPFVGIALAMGYELSRDLLRAARLSTELRITERRLQQAADAAGLGLWEWDLDADRIWIPDSGRKLYGVAPGGPVPFQRFADTVYPDDRDGVNAAIAKALAGPDPYTADYRILLPDGTTRWIAANGQVERNADGGPVLMRGVSIDITDRHLAEERFRSVVEASPNALIVSDTEGRIVMVNAGTERIFDYPRAELIGESIERLLPGLCHSYQPPHRQSGLTDAETSPRAMGTGRDRFGQRRDGSEIPVEIGMSPLRTGEGIFVLASVVDITERKRVEQDTLRQRGELAHLGRVAILSELSGSLAHELNQPLAAILGNAQAALRFMDRDPGNVEEVREILTDIAGQGRRAGEVIRRMRGMLKKGEPLMEELHLPSLAEDVLRLIRSDLVARHVAVATDFTVPPPAVLGDRIQLQQVILNLFLNACDAMGDTVPEQRILTVSTPPVPGLAVLHVQDRGHGLGPGTAEVIFDPFHTTKPDGLGMGLPISRSILTTHGGRLTAENHPDGGALLRLELPAHQGSFP